MDSTSMRVAYDACPLCHCESAVEVHAADCSGHPRYQPQMPKTLHWLKCDGCAHVFADSYFSTEGLELLFREAHPGQTPGQQVDRARDVAARIVERVARLRNHLGGLWLDVGFGSGALVTTAAEFGYDVIGIDTRQRPVELLREFGYEAHQVEFTDYYPERLMDIVSMNDVLEHMAFPKRALEHAHRLLGREGVLLTSMPNKDSFLWEVLDRKQLNPYWGELEHLHNFGVRRLYSLLRECGFEPRSYSVSERYIAGMEVAAQKIS